MKTYSPDLHVDVIFFTYSSSITISHPEGENKNEMKNEKNIKYRRWKKILRKIYIYIYTKTDGFLQCRLNVWKYKLQKQQYSYTCKEENVKETHRSACVDDFSRST